MGVRLTPGFLSKESEARPGINKMIQGCTLELRKPDGSSSRTHLVTYRISVEKDHEGNIIYRGDIKNPEIKITLPADVPDAELTPGTEVWLVE